MPPKAAIIVVIARGGPAEAARVFSDVAGRSNPLTVIENHRKPGSPGGRKPPDTMNPRPCGVEGRFGSPPRRGGMRYARPSVIALTGGAAAPPVEGGTPAASIEKVGGSCVIIICERGKGGRISIIVREGTMIGIVIASHTDMAENIIDTVAHIIGEHPRQVVAFSTGLGVEKEEIKLGFTLAIGEVDSGDGVLVLTDISGGTPAVLLDEYLGRKEIEVVTGVNLPMALAAILSREGRTLLRLTKMAVKAGKTSIFSLKSTPKT